MIYKNSYYILDDLGRPIETVDLISTIVARNRLYFYNNKWINKALVIKIYGQLKRVNPENIVPFGLYQKTDDERCQYDNIYLSEYQAYIERIDFRRYH
jgi:hypothetical protein